MELQHRDQGLCELTPVSTPTLAANSRFTARREDPHGEPRAARASRGSAVEQRVAVRARARVRVGEVCVKTDRGARVKRKPEQVCRAAEWSQWTDIAQYWISLPRLRLTAPHHVGAANKDQITTSMVITAYGSTPR
jgi:hypothetical protein